MLIADATQCIVVRTTHAVVSASLLSFAPICSICLPSRHGGIIDRHFWQLVSLLERALMFKVDALFCHT